MDGIKAYRSFQGRSPKQNKQKRTCEQMNCTQLLSIYNKKKFCFAHAPRTYPRVRGHLVRGVENE